MGNNELWQSLLLLRRKHNATANLFIKDLVTLEQLSANPELQTQDSKSTFYLYSSKNGVILRIAGVFYHLIEMLCLNLSFNKYDVF